MWVIKLNGGNHLKFNGGYLEGVTLSTSDLSDFNVANPQVDQILVWDGADWVNSTVSFGGLDHSRKDASFTAEVGTHYSVDTTNGAVTVTLPDISTVSSGNEVRVYFRTRGAGNNILIARDQATADTINGQASFTLDVQYDSITLVANTTDSLWEVI